MTGAELRHILSSNIKALRNQRSLSQIELAERADISTPFLSNIERSNKWPYPDTLVKIARALDVEVHALFHEPDAPDPDLKKLLARLKKDISASLHKTLSQAIDQSLEKTIEPLIAEKRMRYTPESEY